MAQSFGEFIRARRRELGLTQREVAEALGFRSVAFLSDIETGHRKPSRHWMPELARVLKTDLPMLEGRDLRVPLGHARDWLEAHPEEAAPFRTVVDHARRLGAGEVVRRIEHPLFDSHPVPVPKAAGWIAVVIHLDISDPRTSSIYLRVAQEVRRLLEEERLASRLYFGSTMPTPEDLGLHCPEFFDDLAAGKIKGIISVVLSEKLPADRLKEKALAVVGSSGDYPVQSDLRGWMEAAVRELVRRGKRRMALLAWGGFENGPSRCADFFRQSVAEAGLVVQEAWIKDDIYPTLHGAGWGAFREIWSARSERPDGLVVCDDWFLNGVIAAMQEMGLSVPDQVGIAAQLADRPMAEYPVPIIAWQPDVPAIARELVRTELAVLRGVSAADFVPRRIPMLRIPERRRSGVYAARDGKTG